MNVRQPNDITEGRWAGWRSWTGLDAYEDLVGPFYFRNDENGNSVGAVEVDARHLNGHGNAHGGFLMTFADNALFSIAWPAIKDTGGVTVHLSGDFTSAGKPGDILQATGEIVRAGGRLIFVRGQITCEDKFVLSFNGIITRLKARPKTDAPAS